MKIFCLIFVNSIVLLNVAAGLRQAWILFRRKIQVCPGVIVSSRLNDEDEWHGGSNKLRMYWPVVEYEYEADGRRLVGNRISMAVVKSSVRKEAEKRLLPYEIGKEVRVFYDASDPSEAWLKNPRNHVGSFAGWAIFMLFFGAAMNFMIWKVVE